MRNSNRLLTNSMLNNSLTQTTMERKKNFKNQFEQNFDPKNFISVGVTERDVELYKEVFDLFDVQGLGCLTPMDVRRGLELFGYNPKKKIVYEIISNIDTEETGGVSFVEFLKIMTDQRRPCDEETKDDIELVFSYFDVDEKGYIDRDDLQQMCLEVGENLSEQELKDIFELLDKKGEEKITFPAFHKAMLEAVKKETRTKKK